MKQIIEKFEIRELAIALIGAGILVTAALSTTLLIPAIKQHRAAADEHTALNSMVAERDSLDAQISAQHEQIEALGKQLDGDMTNLPAKQVEAYIVGRLQRVSWENEVELVSVEPAIGERVQIFQEVIFNIELNGGYRQLYRWLRDLRQELGFVVIKQYELQRADNEDIEPMLSARLSVASYRATSP